MGDFTKATIFIYTTHKESSESLPTVDTIECPRNEISLRSEELSPPAESVETSGNEILPAGAVLCSRENIPKDRHPVLAANFGSVTMYVEGIYKRETLTSNISYVKPEGICTVTKFWTVSKTPGDVHRYVYRNSHRGKKRDEGGNAHDFINEILGKLLGEIEDTDLEAGCCLSSLWRPFSFLCSSRA